MEITDKINDLQNRVNELDSKINSIEEFLKSSDETLVVGPATGPAILFTGFEIKRDDVDMDVFTRHLKLFKEERKEFLKCLKKIENEVNTIYDKYSDK